MRTDARRSCLMLLAAALLLGQAAGLQHEHARSAECPPGTCLDHAAAHEAPRAIVADAEGCALCDLAAQGRVTQPGQAVRSAEAPVVAFRLLGAPQPAAPVATVGAGTGPRAPPASA